MSTLRIHGIEAKSDPTSASVNEKIKITNSNGDLLLHLDGTQAGIGTVGITTTGTTFHVDRATGEITFVTDAKFDGTVGIAGTLTYEDVTNIDAIGIITARDGIVVSDTTESNSPTTGSVKISGGLGVVKNLIKKANSEAEARTLKTNDEFHKLMEIRKKNAKDFFIPISRNTIKKIDLLKKIIITKNINDYIG